MQHVCDAEVSEDTVATVCHFIMLHYADPTTTTKKPAKRAAATPAPSKNTFILHASLKQIEQAGVHAISNKLNQFNVLNTFMPVEASMISYEK
jgi:hypothetical protein